MTAPRKKTYAYQSIPDVGQGGPSFHLAPYLPGYSSPQYPDTATDDPAQYGYQSIPDVGPAGTATNRAQPQAAYDPGASMGSLFNQGFIPVTNPVIQPYVPPPPIAAPPPAAVAAASAYYSAPGGPYSGGGPVAAGLAPPQVMLGVS